MRFVGSKRWSPQLVGVMARQTRTSSGLRRVIPASSQITFWGRDALPQAPPKGYHRRQGFSIFARHRLSGAGQGQVTPSFFWPRPASWLDPWHCRPVELKVVGDQPKPDVVVRVVRVVPVAIPAAGVVLIVVPRPATQHTVSCWPVPAFRASSPLRRVDGLTPGSQQSPDLCDYLRHMTILTGGKHTQILAQSQVETQFGQVYVCPAQRPLSLFVLCQPGFYQMLLKSQGRLLNRFGQNKTLFSRKLGRGRNEPDEQIVGFGENGRLSHLSNCSGG